METKGKVENPIILRLSHLGNEILPSGDCNKSYPLSPGAILGAEHYGFCIISDGKKCQRSRMFKTFNKIVAVGIENDVLKIFEDGILEPWIFDLKGKLLAAVNNEKEFNYDSRDIFIDNEDFFGVGKKIYNPITIQIKKDPFKNCIKFEDEIFPVYPGLSIGRECYGFILEIETENGINRKIYATQTRIDGVSRAYATYENISVFEEGKYHPWKIDDKGNIVSPSKFEKYSKRDIEYIEKHYPFEGEDAIKRLNLQNKS